MAHTLISLLTFFLGLLLGNWLAIGRDKRKEFNEANAPIRAWLLKEKDDPTAYGRSPSDVEFDRFIHLLPAWKRSSFRVHLDKYKESHKRNLVQDAYGSCTYSDVEEVRRALNNLFIYTRHR